MLELTLLRHQVLLEITTQVLHLLEIASFAFSPVLPFVSNKQLLSVT